MTTRERMAWVCELETVAARKDGQAANAERLGHADLAAAFRLQAADRRYEADAQRFILGQCGE